ncbi:unnamed protein product [Phytomonas sp. EM1]|nr:unnamed protein product [Phytomonas sp. EM1]|eukprot:CCW64633.1 unnamed protein product [Phytomonas sp. isolate EM1]
MAIPPKMLERRTVFGVRENVKDGIQYLDDDNIVWVAGTTLILLDTQMGVQELTPCSPSCESVTAMTLSLNHHVLAVAESGSNPCIAVYLFDATTKPRLRGKKILQISDVGSSEYVSLSFSQDGKYLAALGGFPEWKIVYWNVGRAKVLSACSVTGRENIAADRHYLNQCSISPNNPGLLCVSGPKTVRFFKLVDNQLTACQTTRGLNGNVADCLAHTWIISDPYQLIVSTSNGDLLLFDNMEYQYPLPISPSDGIPLHALKAYSKGFVCGGDMGLIIIFERTDNKEMYRKVRSFQFTSDGEPRKETVSLTNQQDMPIILSFTITPPPAEETLAFLTSTKQIYCLNLPNVDFNRVDDYVFQPVGQPFHTGPVVGVDMSSQRPLVVTASRNGQVFIWNSITNSVEMRKRFNSEIRSVAIHPSGLHLLVGFVESLKLMNIYAKDIREFKTIDIRSCCACAFSTGGQFYAAAHSSTIHVYFTYTCELLGHLRGHSGKVKSLYFVPPDDTRIISTGADGAIYEFNLMDFHKVNDNVVKAIAYNCSVADVGTIWAAGNDRKLRQLDRHSLQKCVEHDLHNASMLSMAISVQMKLLFGGCDDGTVRVLNTYLGEKLFDRDRESLKSNTGTRPSITIETHPAHTGGVSMLALSYNESVLVSVGEDGLVVLWDVVAPHRGGRAEIEYSNELLIDRHELEKIAKLIESLQNQVIDLKQRMVQQQLEREQSHEENIAKMERDYRRELSKLTEKINALDSEKNEQAIRFTEYMAELEAKTHETTEQTEEDYSAKISSMHDRVNQLRILLSEQRAEYESKVAEIRREAAAQRAAQQVQRTQSLQQLEEQYHALLLKKEQNDAETEAMNKWIEEDNDIELIKCKESYEKRRREQEEELAALQIANSLMFAQENIKKTELASKTADVMDKLRQQATLEGQIDTAKHDIKALTNELRERGDAIEEKERRIADLQLKNQGLNKFKFVLEYKIKELKAQIEPREAEIRSATEKLTCMDAEAERYQHSNENLVLQIRNLRQKRAGRQKEVDSLTTKMKAVEEFQSRLWTELCDVHDEIHNPRRLKEMAKALFDKYTSNKPQPAVQKTLTSRTATDEVRDYHRERDHLERNLASLKKKVNRDAENNRADKNRILSENVILVKEINDLRKEARTLAIKVGIIRPTDPSASAAYEESYLRELETYKAELTKLKQIAERLEGKLKAKNISIPGMSGMKSDCGGKGIGL